MDFREFRVLAKEAGLAVDQHTYQGPMFVLMLGLTGTLVIPAGREALGKLLDFSKRKDFELRRHIEHLHASTSELEAGRTVVYWQPYDSLPGANPEMRQTVHGQIGYPRVTREDAPRGRVFLKDWLEDEDANPADD